MGLTCNELKSKKCLNQLSHLLVLTFSRKCTLHFLLCSKLWFTHTSHIYFANLSHIYPFSHTSSLQPTWFSHSPLSPSSLILLTYSCHSSSFLPFPHRYSSPQPLRPPQPKITNKKNHRSRYPPFPINLV